MGHDKLRKFAENATFACLIQPATEEVLGKDHPLKGNLKGVRELHIQPDWLLMYIRNKRELVLTLTRTGTHADLLKR